MMDIKQLTEIGRIGFIKESGDEWAWYSKEIELKDVPDYATVKMTSDGVSAIYVNGEFVETHMGRLPNRILYVEITSKLRKGLNKIQIEVGSHFYQQTAMNVHKRRGSWFSCVAAEIMIQTKESQMYISTDESWECTADIGKMQTTVLSEVSMAEYERFWKHAALWKEVPQELTVPKEILEVAGASYEEYIKKGDPKYVYPKVLREDEGGIVYDFGRVVVGYTIIEYESEEDSSMKLFYDYTESVDDFDPKARAFRIVDRLAVETPVVKGKHTVQIIRRRAGRYLYVKSDCNRLKIKSCKMMISMTPATQKGWFRCNDSLLNEIWEVGKYTLWVNKHQEYESCPRHELKFFSGDGIVAALIDYYAFGYEGLVDASLACTERSECIGLRHDKYSRNDELWDYPALRILMAYNHYKYYGDKTFLKHYYPELVTTLMWLVDKVGSDNLIYQYPVWYDGFFTTSGSVEYSCSFDRLGQKTYLNALVYQSLVRMSELGKVMGDEKSESWKLLAEKICNAMNEKLWSEEKKAYIDLQYPDNYAQDGNVLAVLFGIADERKSRLIFDSLEKHNWSPFGSTMFSENLAHTRKGNQTISPLMCGYEAEARFSAGEHESALELIRRCWGTMIQKGAGTFWEFAPNDAKGRWIIPSHAWSAAPTYLLSAYVLGIRPEKPGYEEMLFEPSDELETFEGVVPTKKGYVAAKCVTEQNKKIYTIVIPKAVKLHVNVPEGAEVNILRYE